MRLGLYAVPFGLGPASKGLAVMNALNRHRKLDWLVFGEGVGFDFLRAQGMPAEFLRTPSIEVDEACAQHVCSYCDGVIVLMHRAWANRLAPVLPVFCIDSLGFMWPDDYFAAYPGIAAVRRYYVQDLFGAAEHLRRTGLEAIRPTPAIVDTLATEDLAPSLRNRDVVHIGGMANPFGVGLHVYARVIDRVLDALDIDRPLVLTSEVAVPLFATGRREVRALRHPEAIAAMRAARRVWSAPGLTSLLELSRLQAPMSPLPPENISQLNNIRNLVATYAGRLALVWPWLAETYSGVGRAAGEREGVYAVAAFNERWTSSPKLLSDYLSHVEHAAARALPLPPEFAGVGDGADTIAADLLDVFGKAAVEPDGDGCRSPMRRMKLQKQRRGET